MSEAIRDVLADIEDVAWSDAMSEAALRLEEALRDAGGFPEEAGLRYALGIVRSMREGKER